MGTKLFNHMCMCVKPYPDGWNLPGGGAQRGNVLRLDGAGDPLTPGYPAKGVYLRVLVHVSLCVSLRVRHVI